MQKVADGQASSPAFPGSYPGRSREYGKLFRIAPFARLAARVRYADRDLEAVAAPARCAELAARRSRPGWASSAPSPYVPGLAADAFRVRVPATSHLRPVMASQEDPVTGLTLIRPARRREKGPRNQGGVIACFEARSHGVRRCSRDLARAGRCGGVMHERRCPCR